MNRFNAIGRLTKDSELRMSTTGVNILTFTLAINSNSASKDGKYKTSFIVCKVLGRAAESYSKYLKKGFFIGIEGEISTSNYEAKDGSKRYVTEVLVTKIEFLESRKSEARETSQPQVVEQSSKPDPYEEFSKEIEITGDDLPF